MIGFHRILFVLALIIADNRYVCFMMNLYKNENKCFYAVLLPYNTLEIKFGFPRKIRDNCHFQLTIDYHTLTTEAESEQTLSYQNLYNKTSYCQQKIPGHLTIIKYTGKNQMDLGKYRICVKNLNDYGTNKSLFELIISQKQNPITNQKLKDKDIVLVNSKDFMALQQIIVGISRRISWMWNETVQVLTLSHVLQKNLKERWQISLNFTYFQIIFIAFYGVVWVCIAKFYILSIKNV